MSATRRRLAAASPVAVCLILLIGMSSAAWAQTPAERRAAEAKATEAKATEAKAAEARTAEAKAAEAKAAEAKAAEAKAAEAKAAQEKAAQEKTPNALWLEASVRLTRAVQELLGGLSWAFVALVVLLFREKLLNVFERLVEAILDRGGSLEVSAFKLQLPERPADEVDEARPLFLPWPFELEDERGSDGGLLWDIPPQNEYQSSDYVGEFRKSHGGGNAAASLEQEFTKLEAACKNGDPFATLKPQLVRYVAALEEARFLDAAALAGLMKRYPRVKTGISELRPAALPGDARDFLVVHASAIASAQDGDIKTCLDLLQPIAWNAKGDPIYPPAGAMWLTASYHSLIDRLRQEDKPLDAPPVQSEVQGYVDRAKRLASELANLDWNTTQLQATKTYYAREFDKDIGDVLSIYAEHVPVPERKRLLAAAEAHLERCVEPQADEPPTPLDHNNLADLYRQRGVLAEPADAPRFFEQAHKALETALTQDVDPTFHDTLAMLFLAERQLDKAWATLAPYVGDQRDESLCAKDPYQCVRNQILAAKLAVRRRGDAGVRYAIDILESALQYVERTRQALKADAVDLEAEVTELLSFAFLRVDDLEKAVAWFDRLIGGPGWRPSQAARLRAGVGRALALGGVARRDRRLSSFGIAQNSRKRAAGDVATVLDLMKNVMKLDAAQSPERMRLVEALWLDAVRAIQLLAEEWYAGAESKSAQELADENTPLLAALAARLRAAPDDADPNERRVLRRVQARHALLRARLLVRLDPALKQSETLTKVVTMLGEVRGAEPQLDCQADLEEGAILLTAVRLGVGDLEQEYAQAIDALERASRQDAPALRAETVRVLVHAYAMRPLVRRKKKSADK